MLRVRTGQSQMNFTQAESAVLKRVQEDIPLVRDPLGAMAAETGMDADGFIETLARMKQQGVVRNISGIFSAAALGYSSALVAFMVPGAFVENAAAVISAHPGVSHNYLRDHEYNIWFTLAVERPEQLRRTVDVLTGRCGAKDAIILNNEKMYKLGVRFAVDDENPPEGNYSGEGGADSGPLSGDEREAVRLLQIDMPLCACPFEKIIRDTGSALPVDDLLKIGASLKLRGALRRYSAVLRHRKAGFTANAMTVWRPASPELMDRAAGIFGRERAVSHLYARTVYPGRWEYPLFAMIHARDQAALDEIIRSFAAQTGITDYRVLRSIEEFKKERVTYFSQKFSDWNARENI